MSLDLTATSLVCPAGKKTDPHILINFGAILAAEARQEEVAFVTPQKAPELLREFNVAWRELHKITTQLSSEHLKAERELEKRKAVLVLDVVPVALKERGLTSNEANRDAIITLDAEYERLQDTCDQIDAVVRLLKGKLAAFENAFTSVKKIMGEDTYNMAGRQNPDLKGGVDANGSQSFVRPNPLAPRVIASPATAGMTVSNPAGPAADPPKRPNGFGKPRY